MRVVVSKILDFCQPHSQIPFSQATRSEKEGSRYGVEGTHHTRITRMIHVNQITIQIQMPPLTTLHRRIRRFLRISTRWEIHLCVYGEGREIQCGFGFGGEFLGGICSVDHFLDEGVGGLFPCWG